MSTDGLRAFGQSVVDTCDALDAEQAANAALQGQLDAASQSALEVAQELARLEAQIAATPPPTPPAPATAFSAYAGPRTRDTYLASDKAAVAAALGVSVLPVDRIYSEGAFGKATVSTSPVVAVSYKQVPGLGAATGPSAATVAAVTAELNTLKAKPGTRFDVSLDHEVDNKVKGGTYDAATYKRAVAVFAGILRSLAAPNVRHAVCYMGWSFTQATSNAWHPVNLWVDGTFDLIALDPYWTSNLTDAKAAFDPGYTWAKTKGVPVAVWETGLYTSLTQPMLGEGMTAQRAAEVVGYWNRRADYVCWFDANKSDGDNRITSHPDACAIWGQAAQGKLA